MSIPS